MASYLQDTLGLIVFMKSSSLSSKGLRLETEWILLFYQYNLTYADGLVYLLAWRLS
jgi:hypothetical protein